MSTVLIVDDEYTITEAISEILTWEGYAVRTAPNGHVALLELEKGDVSLVLLDYMMPLMDGLQLLQIIRERDDLKDLPVVLMTAIAEHQLPGPKGWNAYLGKPFELTDLLDLVSKFSKA